MAAIAVTSERGPRWRRGLSWVLLILFCVLAPLGLIAGWAHALVFNTDRYVATVDQLAGDAAVEDAVSAAVSDAVFNRFGSALGSRLTPEQVFYHFSQLTSRQAAP